MCSTVQLHTDKSPFEKKYSLASFFDLHWNKYLKSPKYPISTVQHKAVNSIRKCRTAALGMDVYTCNDCGKAVEIYHSCRNRFCPNCSWTETVKWAKVVYSHLLNIPLRHVVLTLPHDLNYLIRRNATFFYETLLRVSSDLMKEYVRRKYHIEAGVISVLHTFGEKKNLHVHVHMIVSWGGIDKKNKLLKAIPFGDYVDYNKLKHLFREKMITAIDRAYNNSLLQHNFIDKNEYTMFTNSLCKVPWIINLEPPMDLPEQVVRYIGRYSKRACLSEYKITNIDGDYISFRYKDYKQKDEQGKCREKILTLHYYDFFPLLLQHVPLRNFRQVRYYGVYATRTKIAEEYKKKSAYVEPSVRNTGIEKTIDVTKTCVSCKGIMTLTKSIIEKGSVRWIIEQKKMKGIQQKKLKKIAA